VGGAVGVTRQKKTSTTTIGGEQAGTIAPSPIPTQAAGTGPVG